MIVRVTENEISAIFTIKWKQLFLDCSYMNAVNFWPGGDSPYDGLYGETPPKRGTFSRALGL